MHFHLLQDIINEMPKVTHLICMTDGHTLSSSDFPSHIKVLSFNEVEMSGALPENSEYLINPLSGMEFPTVINWTSSRAT